jgi:hypothetical protein
MNLVIVMLLTFVALGLARDRLGPTRAYAAMSVVILAYVIYAYSTG